MPLLSIRICVFANVCSFPFSLAFPVDYTLFFRVGPFFVSGPRCVASPRARLSAPVLCMMCSCLHSRISEKRGKIKRLIREDQNPWHRDRDALPEKIVFFLSALHLGGNHTDRCGA